MKRIRRSISPLVIAVLGIWLLLQQSASLTVLGIAVIVLSTLGIILSVTDKESSKVSKTAHLGLDGVFAAGGAWLLISPLTLNRYLKYILGGIAFIFCLLTLVRMIRYKYRTGFKIAECVPVLLGAGLMLIPLADNLLMPASGGVLTAAGVITLLGNLFGKKKDVPEAAVREALKKS